MSAMTHIAPFVLTPPISLSHIHTHTDIWSANECIAYDKERRHSLETITILWCVKDTKHSHTKLNGRPNLHAHAHRPEWTTTQTLPPSTITRCADRTVRSGPLLVLVGQPYLWCVWLRVWVCVCTYLLVIYRTTFESLDSKFCSHRSRLSFYFGKLMLSLYFTPYTHTK